MPAVAVAVVVQPQLWVALITRSQVVLVVLVAVVTEIQVQGQQVRVLSILELAAVEQVKL
jgi:hypothetical protein